jgi:TonB-linked SusC/RagA family outer membrane protein
MKFPRCSVSLIMKISFVCITLIVGGQQSLRGNDFYQELDKLVTIGADNETLSALLQKLKAQTELSFVFPSDYSGITFEKETRTVREVLDLALRGTNLAYALKGGTVIIYERPKEEGKKKAGGGMEVSDMNNKNIVSVVTVSGVVRGSSNQEPLPGVSVVVQNTTDGTTTDGAGKFLVNAEYDDVLVFSSIGFRPYETPVGGRSVIDVVLEEDVALLDEVVVHTGYYDVKDREKTGGISKVTSEVIGKQPVTSPLGALIGRMPGVNIQQTTGVPGGDFKIEIRGRNSLRSNGNDPLFIVDGVPFSTEKVSNQSNTGYLMIGGVSPFTSINSADIESIEVLKDADATAIYGSRGANGVVLITTKKGKTGRTKFDINYYSAFAKTALRKLLNTKQYLAVRREAFANDNITPTGDPDDNKGLNGKGYAPDLMVWDTTRYTDWQKIFIGNTAKTNSLQASVSGGNDKTQFLLSAGYYSETTVFPGDFKYRKLSVHQSFNHTSSNKKFFLNTSINGSLDKHHQPRTDFAWPAQMLAPDAPALYNEDGSLNWAYHPVTGQATWTNPMADLVTIYDGDMTNVIANLTIGYEILKGLKVQSLAGYNHLGAEELTVIPSTRFDPKEGRGPEQSECLSSNGKTSSWILEPQLNWEKKMAKGQLSFLIGGTYQKQDHRLSALQYRGFPSNILMRDPSAASDRWVNQFASSIYKYAAIYARVNYNWNGKYIINLTGRRDGSSRFGPGKQFSNFGALGAAWIFSEEPFIKNNFSLLSFAKLRGSFGITGSDQIGNYEYLDTFQTPDGINSYDGVTALDPTRLSNPYFGWESNKKIEGALELGFFQDRIFIEAGFYRNRSSNQLVNYTLPKTTGFGGIQANLDATVQNTGVEIQITTQNINHDALNWTTSVNLSIPRNKLMKFPNLDSSSYSNTYIIGESLYIQKFYEYTGINPETGLYTVRDYNGDGVISYDADGRKAMFVGQDFYGGINNIVIYNGWTVEFFFQFVKQTGTLSTFPYGYQNRNFPIEVLGQDRWRQSGDQAEIQRFATEYTQGIGAGSYGSPHDNYANSDASVTDASFIRLKTVSLDYQVPQKWMKGLKCNVFIRGQNLFVFTRYKGADPEIGNNINRDSLPPLRTVSVGLKLIL